MMPSNDPNVLLPWVESDAIVRHSGIDLFLQKVRPSTPFASLIVIHGYGDHSGRHLHFMRWIAQRGVACYALDLRGQGRSTGRPGYVVRWEDYLDDLGLILSLPELPAEGPSFILGHSHGGLLVSAALERGLAKTAGCILTSPFFAPHFKVPLLKTLLARIVNPVLPWLRVSSGLGDYMLTTDAVMRTLGHNDPLSRRFATPRWYLGALKAQARVLAAAPEFKVPLLLLCGGDDGIADVPTAEAFFASAGSIDKAMKVYPGLLHEILRETIREQIFTEILQWIVPRARAISGVTPPS
jgi:lysophospholipase